MRKFRTYADVEHGTGSELLEQVVEQRQRLNARLESVGSVVAVASGKGGVGKSAITANLAVALAGMGRKVGVVDADLNGPSAARMLGVIGRSLEETDRGVIPPEGVAGVRVVSMELLQAAEDAPLRWRDPGADAFLWQSSMETTALREFLSDVVWDGCDFLLVDVPPGTDKIGRLLELVPGLPAMVMVTTPSEMSRSVVSRSIRLARDAGIPTLALVANMVGYLCPDCGKRRPLFRGDGHIRLSESAGLPLWAELPFDPRFGEATDRGTSLILSDPASQSARIFGDIAERLRSTLEEPEEVP